MATPLCLVWVKFRVTPRRRYPIDAQQKRHLCSNELFLEDTNTAIAGKDEFNLEVLKEGKRGRRGRRVVGNEVRRGERGRWEEKRGKMLQGGYKG